MRAWISRDWHESNDEAGVDIWTIRPKWLEGYCGMSFYDGDPFVSCCADEFEKFTGISIKPGELHLVDIDVKFLTGQPEECHAPDGTSGQGSGEAPGKPGDADAKKAPDDSPYYDHL